MERRISYYYDPGVGNFFYGSRHPMKPYRLSITNSLVLTYGLYERMHVFRPRKATKAQLCAYHAPSFIEYLCKGNTMQDLPDADFGPVGGAGDFPIDLTGNPLLNKNYTKDSSGKKPQKARIRATGDCPVFDGLFSYVQIFTGASIEAAQRLNAGLCDVAINWSGGMHHAHKALPSGFCYANDIVLAILELLKHHPRVLYVDIDIHHGDGVQEAFYFTDRVMTLSLHKYGEGFFPGTGSLQEVGFGAGKYTTINVPLDNGIGDEAYMSLFKPIMENIMQCYRPTAIVLQCGADSIKLDRLGCFNLSHRGHGDCVRYALSFNVPTLILGGGGYTVKNVCRAWTYETGIICGMDKDLEKATIPESIDYYPSFAPNWDLLPKLEGCFENKNSREDLDFTRETVLTNIRRLQGAPAVNMPYVPSPAFLLNDFSKLKDLEGEYERMIQDPEIVAMYDPDQRDLTGGQGGIPPIKLTEFYSGEKDQDH